LKQGSSVHDETIVPCRQSDSAILVGNAAILVGNAAILVGTLRIKLATLRF
jgi:hypothetical protein